MLNAPDLDFLDAPTAAEAWKPDAVCLAAGDEYVYLVQRCYAAAMLSDAQIARRLLDRAGVDTAPASDNYRDAAVALARHCARMDVPLRHIIAILAYLAAEVPCWPDPDENAAIAQAAVAEFA